ncbi:MAG: PKD domain-containing protein [Candidatus Kapaibacterium sp.]
MKKTILLAILFLLSHSLILAQRYTWTERTSAGSRNWRAVASSANGGKLVAVANFFVHISTDSGSTWVNKSPGNFTWCSVASSYDATKIIVGNTYDIMYRSQDAGSTWLGCYSAGWSYWSAIASSSDGSKLIAADGNNGYLYTFNSGGTWTRQTASGLRNWRSLTSSSNGSIIAAIHDSTGYVYTSTNSGVTWTTRTSAGNRQWKSIASSADGLTLVAANGNPGYLYLSADTGATWTARTAAGARYWSAVAISSDGSTIVAAEGSPGYIYISTDSGTTWTTQTRAGSRAWSSVAVSADGRRVIACTNNGYLYTGANIPHSIAASPLSKSIYCQGSSLSIPYAAFGEYDSTNVFTAQLSDSAGSFAAPITIGTRTSTVTGTITATIPPTTSLGNAYKVRVISSSPAITGTPNAGTVSIHAAVAQYKVTGGGGYCVGDTGVVIGLSNTQLGVRYQFQKNGTDTLLPLDGTGAAISFGVQSDTGTYSVLATDTVSGCTQMQGSVKVSIFPLPKTYDISGGGSYCEGDPGVPVSLPLSDLNTTYRLLADEKFTGITKDGTGSAIDFGLQTQPGTYSVVAVHNLTNCTARMTRPTLVIKNARPPQPTIEKIGNELSSSADIGNQWYSNDQIILGATTKTYTPTMSGRYTVKAKNSTCTSLMSAGYDYILDTDKLSAGFNASTTKGAAPLTINFTDATTGNPTSWSWDFGDNQTSTQQNPTHTYTTPGNYTVKLTVSNAITNDTKTKESFIIVEKSSSVTNDGSGDTQKKVHLTSIPNPATDEAIVRIESGTRTMITLSLYNVLGNKVQDIYTGEIGIGNTDIHYSVQDATIGNYYLMARYAGGTVMGRVQVVR